MEESLTEGSTNNIDKKQESSKKHQKKLKSKEAIDSPTPSRSANKLDRGKFKGNQ